MSPSQMLYVYTFTVARKALWGPTMHTRIFRVNFVRCDRWSLSNICDDREHTELFIQNSIIIIIIIIDRFSLALFPAPEQTHCVHVACDSE